MCSLGPFVFFVLLLLLSDARHTRAWLGEIEMQKYRWMNHLVPREKNVRNADCTKTPDFSINSKLFETPALQTQNSSGRKSS